MPPRGVLVYVTAPASGDGSTTAATVVPVPPGTGVFQSVAGAVDATSTQEEEGSGQADEFASTDDETPPPVDDEEEATRAQKPFVAPLASTTEGLEREDEDENASSTTSFELEVCERCKREGEVLECDFEGCEKLWHVECVPDLNGKIPEGRWICPGPHDESCEVCGGSGEVVLCDVKNCGRMYHVHCLPELKGKIPKGYWECPKCVQDREEGLKCAVCNKGRADTENNAKGGDLEKLIKCTSCDEALHLACAARYGSPVGVACAACNFKRNAFGKRPRPEGLQKVKITFTPNLTAIEKARILQIVRGDAAGLSDAEARACLDMGIAKRFQKATPIKH